MPDESRIDRNWSEFISIDRNWSTLGSMPEFWLHSSALIIDWGSLDIISLLWVVVWFIKNSQQAIIIWQIFQDDSKRSDDCSSYGGRQCPFQSGLMSQVCRAECKLTDNFRDMYNISVWISPHVKDMYHVTEIQVSWINVYPCNTDQTILFSHGFETFDFRWISVVNFKPPKSNWKRSNGNHYQTFRLCLCLSAHLPSDQL